MTREAGASRTRAQGPRRRSTVASMLMEVTCRCGWTCRGTEDDVIAQVQAHGVEAHGVTTTPDEVRAIWRPVSEDAGA